MRNKLLCLLLAAALTALTAGCSLARPEQENAPEERWIGLYVVYDPPGTYTDFSSNPNLVELGTESLDAGKYGSLTIPREVLLGEEDPDTGDIVFPGLAGYSLFIRHIQEDSGYVTAVQSDMSPGEEGTAVASSDEGVAESADGLIWWGPPLDAAADFDPDASPHGIWHGYNVYETSDGQVYLDGTGNSYGGAGSGMGFSSDAAYTYTENGEIRKDSISAAPSDPGEGHRLPGGGGGERRRGKADSLHRQGFHRRGPVPRGDPSGPGGPGPRGLSHHGNRLIT